MNKNIYVGTIFILVAPITSTDPIDPSLGFYYLINYQLATFHNRTRGQNDTSSSPEAPIPRRLVEGSADVVLFNVTGGDQRLADNALSDFYAEQVVATSRNPRVAKVLDASFFLGGQLTVAALENLTLRLEDPGDVSLGVHVSGHGIGRTVIDILVIGHRTDKDIGGSYEEELNLKLSRGQASLETRILASFDVTVVRRKLYKTLSFAFTIFVAVITVITTFLIGTKLDWRIVIKEIKDPVSLLIGIGLEFFMMPLIAYTWAVVILQGNFGWQLAYLAIGACPGGGHSPFWTMMLDGNLDLAVAMSFVASVSALGILPFWLFTLGRIFYAGRFAIPYVTILISLFGLVCPIFLGLLFRHFLPEWADRFGKIVKHVTFVSFVVLGAFGCAVNWYVFQLLDWRHLVCGVLLPWCGYFLAYSISRWVFRRNHADSLAISVENGCLNVAIPTVLIQLTLPDVEADLSLVVPIGVVIFSSWPLWIYFLFLAIKKRKSMPVLPLLVLTGDQLRVPSRASNKSDERRKTLTNDGSSGEITLTLTSTTLTRPSSVAETIAIGTQTEKTRSGRSNYIITQVG